MKKDSSSSLLEQVTAVYVALMLTVFLLYPGLKGYTDITQEKWRLFLWLSGGYFSVITILWLKQRFANGSSVDFRFRRRQPQQLLMIGFLLWSVLSTLSAVDRKTAFEGSARRDGLVTLLLYGVSCLLVSIYGKPGKWMLWLLGGAVSLNCGISLLQLAGYNPLELYPIGMNYYDANICYAGTFLGTVGNIDILSALLCAAIPIFWVSMVVLNGKKRFLLAFPLLLSLVVLWKASVAGGILGVLGGAVLTIPVLPKENARRRRAAVEVLCLIICILILIYVWGSRFGGFFYEASQVLHGRWEDSFGSGRVYIWRSIWPLIKERPWLGGGPDTLGLRTNAAFERYDAALGILIRSKIDAAHNEYLNLLVNQGIPALALYLGMLMVSAIQWIRYAWKHPPVAICGSGILCYCIQAFFGISSPAAAPYLWLALAFLINGVSDIQRT